MMLYIPYSKQALFAFSWKLERHPLHCIVFRSCRKCALIHYQKGAEKLINIHDSHNFLSCSYLLKMYTKWGIYTIVTHEKTIWVLVSLFKSPFRIELWTHWPKPYEMFTLTVIVVLCVYSIKYKVHFLVKFIRNLRGKWCEVLLAHFIKNILCNILCKIYVKLVVHRSFCSSLKNTPRKLSCYYFYLKSYSANMFIHDDDDYRN